MKTHEQSNAAAAHSAAKIKEAEKRLARISAELARYKRRPQREINWAVAGDLGRLCADIKDIQDWFAH